MLTYLLRRLFYTLPIVLGVMLLTFFLFFMVTSPENVARRQLGKNPTPELVRNWLKTHGYDKPQFVNLPFDKQYNPEYPWWDSQFTTHMRATLLFQFGKSDATGEDIGDRLRQGAGPSALVTLPAFLVTLLVTVSLSLVIALYRGSYLDWGGMFICVLLMSVPIMVYIIAGQWLLGLVLRYFPIFGFATGTDSLRFILLPLVIGVIVALGASVRFYRTVMLDEIGQDYTRTARAKGLSERVVLFKHVLKNALIPILTNVVADLPLLILGSLLLENFFGIPGLGNLAIVAINELDFSLLRALVFLGSLLYIVGLLLTDISYTLVDPRVRLD
ncbi:ABC transporter permease [Anthocerotibacter panamensis]|uniref:ABC transporter permease n=1 Tax=Anthocerotibacter panamensis TaxID=2857077 RepID=UPI001C40220D|nr:ABC transporter permease [Anthocerotibacter panamensis]